MSRDDLIKLMEEKLRPVEEELKAKMLQLLLDAFDEGTNEMELYLEENDGQEGPPAQT